MALENTLNLVDKGSNIVRNVVNTIGNIFSNEGLFGHSSWYKTLKNAQAQNQANQEMALWNMENITKPVYQMEAQEYDRRFAGQQAEWDRQFQAQNEYNETYNSPAAQVQRLREAGINPAGQGIDGNTVQAAGGQIPNPSINEAASAFAQPASIFEAMTARAQAELAEANARRARTESRLTERNIQEKEINMETLRELNEGRVELQYCEIETQKSNQKLTRQKIKESKALVKQIDSYSATLEKQIPILDQQLKNAKEEFNEIRSRTFLNQAQEANTDQKTLNLQSEKVYQDIVNKWADQNQEWLIKEAKARYNRTNAEAQKDLEEAKLMIQQGNITDWKFQNTQDAWQNKGYYEMQFDGKIARWKYNNANLFTNLDKSRMELEKIQNEMNARFFMINSFLNATRNKTIDLMGGIMTKAATGAAGKTGVESYQFFE